MITLETGEESVYAVDTQSGELQNQSTHVLLDDPRQGYAISMERMLEQSCA